MRQLRDATFVFVSSRSGPSLARAERRWLKVIRALTAEGAGVHVICTPRSAIAKPAAELGATLAPYRLDRFNLLRTRSRMRKYLKRFEPAVAHATGYEANVLLRWAAADLPVRVVSSEHCGSWPPTGLGPIDTWFRRRLDRDSWGRVDVFTVDCPSLAERMAEAGIPQARIAVFPPSVDLARVADEARVTVALPDGQPRIGYAGGLERSRGLSTLAVAAERLKATYPDARVIVAGRGGAGRSHITGAVRDGRLDLLDAVESVPAVLAALDVCCFPVTDPGMPTSLLEAIALGRPVVASDVPGIADLFGPDELTLVPPGDAEALADAVIALLAEPERARAMAERARHRVVDEYSAVASVARHLALLRELGA